jgi:hypothetical protein
VLCAGHGNAEASDQMSDILAQVSHTFSHSCNTLGWQRYPDLCATFCSISTEHVATLWQWHLQVASNIDATRNAGNAVLYECVQVCMCNKGMGAEDGQFCLSWPCQSMWRRNVAAAGHRLRDMLGYIMLSCAKFNTFRVSAATLGVNLGTLCIRLSCCCYYCC